jgi:hypothetical protein
MAKDALVSDELAKKFSTEKDTPYLRWVRGEGLDIISAHYVQNLNTVALKPWARRGGSGVYINHEASRTSNDCYVCEIPPGKKLEPQRQLFEERANASPSSGRRAPSSPSRSTAGTSTSTAPGSSRRATSP